MENKYILGIDGGSQSSKVTIFDYSGNIIAEGKENLTTMYTPQPGVAEHPGDDLYDSIIIATKKALAQFNGNLSDISAIGLCSIRCCRCLVKKDGTLASPVQSWMDVRLSSPYVHENDEVAYVTTTTGYLMGRLTDCFSDTIANYIGPWPMDVEKWDWFSDQEQFDSYTTKHEMLYELMMPQTIGGYTSPSFAKATGLPTGIPVVHTANDKAVEALGTGLNDNKTGLV
ncbi:MAG: FGGY family carbohydrate kinase, partial [Bacilli bacterium]